MRTSHGEIKRINGKRVASPEYRSWQSMRNRCFNKNSVDYKYYGGRGISTCISWKEFNNFLNDMGRKPYKDYTLERIDGDKDYGPDNCIWATRKAQARNRDYAKTKSWLLADQLGVKQMTAHHYIWRVRAMDKSTKLRREIELGKDLELKVRAFMKEHNLCH